MTSTNFTVGLGEGNRNSSKVLKPPGGGSSDIFGRPDEVDQSPRKVRSNHHLKSSVFGANGTSEARSKPGNDTHSRLFGPVDSQPQCASLNRMKSNIPFGLVAGGSELEQSFKSTSLKSAVVENGLHEMSTPKDGNPVTGEGYSAVANDEKESPSTLPAATTTIGTGSAEIRRNRVPPGGYSSGLW